MHVVLWGDIAAERVHARCIHSFSLFRALLSFSLLLPISLSLALVPSLARSLARLGSAQIGLGLARVEGHRAHRPQLSRQFVPNGDDFFRRRDTPLHVAARLLLAASRIFPGEVARRRIVTHTHTHSRERRSLPGENARSPRAEVSARDYQRRSRGRFSSVAC